MKNSPELQVVEEAIFAVQKAGFGEVRVRISDGCLVHITQSIGLRLTGLPAITSVKAGQSQKGKEQSGVVVDAVTKEEGI